jgi:hypothetical protein
MYVHGFYDIPGLNVELLVRRECVQIRSYMTSFLLAYTPCFEARQIQTFKESVQKVEQDDCLSFTQDLIIKQS